MIQFPSGFDTVQFASDIFTLAAPFVGLVFLIVIFVVLAKVLNQVGR